MSLTLVYVAYQITLLSACVGIVAYGFYRSRS